MLLLKLLSTLTVPVMGLILEYPHGIRLCQEKCRQLSTSVDFSQNLLQCALNMNISDRIARLEPSVHWGFKGTTADCRACTKKETCAGKLKKNSVPVRRRLLNPHAHEDRHLPSVPKGLYATGSFEPCKYVGISQENKYRSLKVDPNYLQVEKSLMIKAFITVPSLAFFFWVVDITVNVFRFTANPGQVLFFYTLDKSKSTTFQQQYLRSVSVMVSKTEHSIRVGQKENILTTDLIQYRLIFVYKRDAGKLMVLAYAKKEKYVKKDSVIRYTYYGPDIISARNGDFLVNQKVWVYVVKNTTTWINLPEWETIRFPRYINEEINRFTG